MSLPSASNKPEEVARAFEILNNFCTQGCNVVIDDICEVFYKYQSNSENAHKKKIARGNIKARTRMILLYDMASTHNGMVLSTDNYTEYLLGFWTLNGDVGDYGMIQKLWKTEVYAIAQRIANSGFVSNSQRLALQACIDATPTDGLGITNSDLDQIGVSSYKEVDEILDRYLCGYNKSVNMDSPVIKRHLQSEFKRKWPIVIERSQLFANDYLEQ
jgi:NAD+ synthetase